jgi:hypothetical protein
MRYTFALRGSSSVIVCSASSLTGTSSSTTMNLHLTDDQAELLLAELDRVIENDRYPFSPRITALREIRAMLARAGCAG